MSVYNLKYYGEIQNFHGHCARVEIYIREEESHEYEVLRIGNICGLSLEIQGAQDDIIVPIIKTQLQLSMVDSNQPTAEGVKYGGWQEFYTSDATLYKVVLKTKESTSSLYWVTRWSGYITPDSWSESLEYGGAITIVARDNIGHLQDFEFSDNGLGISGLISLYNIVTEAMNVIDFPMTLQWLGDATTSGELVGDTALLKNALVNVELYKGRSWEEALAGVLESAGLVLRFTDENTFTVSPLRYLPNMGHNDPAARTDMAVMEFYNGDAEIVPAVKQISETHNYNPNEQVYEPLTEGLEHRTSPTYMFSFEGVGGSAIDWIREKNFHVEAYYTPLSSAGSTVWNTGSDMLVPYASWINDWRLKERVDGFALLAANSYIGTTGSHSCVQTISCPCHTSDVTLTLNLAGTPITITNTNNWPGNWHNWRPMELNGGLTYIKYQLAYKVGNSTKYWDGKKWVSTAQTITEEFDPYAYASELKIRLTKCDLGDGGVLVLSFLDIHYQAISQPLPGFYEWRGVYARLNRVAIECNSPKLYRSSVTTHNNDAYNVKVDRQPDFLPLSKEVDWIDPQSYPTALFISAGELFPFKVKWNHEADCVAKPLPVMIHQQLLCYYGASLWKLYGDCAPSGDAMFWFNRLCRYQNRNFVLQGGVWDLMEGRLQGAILREYINYDDIWDDTEDTQNWEESYNTDTTSGSSGSGSSGGGGSSSGGSGGGAGGGVSMISVWRSLANNPNLASYDDQTKIALEHLPLFLELNEYEAGRYAIKVKPTAIVDGNVVDVDGLFTEGFLTAGGSGSSGGGGGSLDLDRMWQSLTNAIADAHASDKIAVDHIPIVVKVGTTSYNPASTGAISLPAYPTTLPASDVYAWAKAASKPSYAFSEITGSATAGQLPAIENLINFATKVYDASASRTKNTVLAAPNGSNGAATFRALVAADIPSLTTGKISDLETWIGNKGFVTKAVNDLTYYYTKSNTYTKTEVNNLIAAINQFHYEIYASTSQVVDPQPNVLYLIGPTGTGSDKYEEYVYANSTWTKIGDTTIDLSQYINSVVASGSGNYVTGISKNGNTITVNYGTLPTTIALANVSDADDLKAIEALSGTSGFLKKTAANTWSLDTKAYLPLTAGSSYPLTGDLHTTSNIFANPEATETEAAFLKEFRINLMGHSNVSTRILWGRETKNKSNGAIIHYTYLNGGHFTCSFQEVAAGAQGYRYFTIGASTPRSSSNSGCGGIRLYGQTEMDSERAYYVSLRPGVVASNKTIVIPDKDGTMALTTDNVASATALANSRTIWGQSFNGSANVSGAMTGVTTLSASGAITAGSFVKSGGTSSQFLKADGSVDSSTYALLSELSTSELVLSGGIANVAARVQSIEDWLRFPALDNLEIDDTLGADIVRANDAYADIFHAATGVVSDGYVTAGAAASSSDARLKDNVQTVPFDKALSILNALRGVEWEWNEKKALLSGKHGSGLVAQEVEKVMPWAVLDLNGELSLNYNSLWGVAIPVMQSHEQRIQQLEAENKALREELETIKAR